MVGKMIRFGILFGVWFLIVEILSAFGLLIIPMILGGIWLFALPVTFFIVFYDDIGKLLHMVYNWIKGET